MPKFLGAIHKLRRPIFPNSRLLPLSFFIAFGFTYFRLLSSTFCGPTPCPFEETSFIDSPIPSNLAFQMDRHSKNEIHTIIFAIQKYIMFLHFCRPREIAGDPNCSGDASTSTLLPTESRDEIDVAELQSELLVLLCPTLGKESDEVRRQSLLGNGTGNVSTGTGNSIQQSV